MVRKSKAIRRDAGKRLIPGEAANLGKLLVGDKSADSGKFLLTDKSANPGKFLREFAFFTQSCGAAGSDLGNLRPARLQGESESGGPLKLA